MLSQYCLNILGFLSKFLIYLVNIKFRKVFNILIAFFDITIFTHINILIFLQKNNCLNFWLRFNSSYILKDVVVHKTCKKKFLYLRLYKHKQLQDIRRIGHLIGEKKGE